MQCVYIVSYTLLLNDQKVCSFHHKEVYGTMVLFLLIFYLMCSNVISYVLLKEEKSRNLNNMQFVR